MTGKKKRGSAIADDPHAGREAEKYERPIPSREFIIQLLEDAGKPLSEQKLIRALDIIEDQEIALSRRLRAMIRDGQLMRNRRGAYGLVDKLDLIRGRVIGHRDGFGFLKPDDGSDDVFLSPRQMKLAFDGDLVLARQVGFTRRGQPEVHIAEVLERCHTHIVGRLQSEQEYWFVVPDNQRIAQHIIVPRKERAKATAGQFVSVEIVSPPSFESLAIGHVIEVLGDHMAPGMEIDVALRAHDIPHIWPAEVDQEIAGLSGEVKEVDKNHRVDLRKLPFVTIDGEDARDFDDAVYAESKKGGGWRLWVSIADVSHYVTVGSALDREAAQRGTSVYFPGQVVPMLPEVLSNGLCSLNPNVDRLCMTCEMTISASGKVSNYVFYEGVFRSAARLTYTQVGDYIDNKALENPALDKPLDTLHEVYKSLRGARVLRGAMDFETHETRIEFGEDRKIDRIVPVVRNEAHKLIEECMLAANVCAARFVEKLDWPGVFRIHEGPGPEKLTNLRDFLGELGLSLGGGAKPEPKDYLELAAKAAGRADAHIIQTMLLRSMSQAVYHVENKGHFGLAYSAYTHFTSPIRRYPDLLVHRAIRAAIRSNDENSRVRRVPKAKPLALSKIYPYPAATMLSLTEHSSMTERRADDATRDVVAFLKCEYLRDRVGEEFSGVVNAVTGFGLFVELEEIYVEGLVHVTALDNDYYHFDAAKQRLQGERTGASFHLGDTLQVRLVAVNLDDRKIDLELCKGGAKIRKGVPSKTPASKPKKGKSGKTDASVKSKKKSKTKDKAKTKAKHKGKAKSKPKSKAKRNTQ
ncbi:MAG: ribonuclease R [Pseudomonadales bacterium]